MSVFSTIIDSLFADENLARDAVYTPPAGLPVAVRVILKTAENLQPSFTASAVVGEVIADLRVSEVAAPAENGVLTVAGKNYVIRNTRIDREGLVWRCGLSEQ